MCPSRRRRRCLRPLRQPLCVSVTVARPGVQLLLCVRSAWRRSLLSLTMAVQFDCGRPIAADVAGGGGSSTGTDVAADTAVTDGGGGSSAKLCAGPRQTAGSGPRTDPADRQGAAAEEKKSRPARAEVCCALMCGGTAGGVLPAFRAAGSSTTWRTSSRTWCCAARCELHHVDCSPACPTT